MKKLFVLSLLSVFVLAACSGSESKNYVSAHEDAACLMTENPAVGFYKSDEHIKAIFADHGYDVENDQAMAEVIAQFKDDEDVKEKINAAAVKCEEDFVAAGVEVTCAVFTAEDADIEELSELSKKIFTKYGFPVDDEDMMRKITLRYEGDTDVQDAIESALRECASELFEE